MRTFVGFVAGFPMEGVGEDPPGRELARFIAAALLDAGLGASVPRAHEGWSWQVETRDGGARVISTVGLVDDLQSEPPRQWLVTSESQVSAWRRLVGGSTLQRRQEALLRRVCIGINEGIQVDGRFNHVTWHDAQTFDTASDVPGAEP